MGPLAQTGAQKKKAAFLIAIWKDVFVGRVMDMPKRDLVEHMILTYADNERKIQRPKALHKEEIEEMKRALLEDHYPDCHRPRRNCRAGVGGLLSNGRIFATDGLSWLENFIVSVHTITINFGAEGGAWVVAIVGEVKQVNIVPGPRFGPKSHFVPRLRPAHRRRSQAVLLYVCKRFKYRHAQIIIHLPTLPTSYASKPSKIRFQPILHQLSRSERRSKYDFYRLG